MSSLALCRPFTRLSLSLVRGTSDAEAARLMRGWLAEGRARANTNYVKRLTGREPAKVRMGGEQLITS